MLEDGQTLQGFRHAPNEHNDFTVWVDPETKLPVEIELKHPTAKQTIFMDEFEFDFTLDESAFSTAVPEGYEVQTVVNDSRSIQNKVVTPDVVASVAHTAYMLNTLLWMESVTLRQMTDPLMKQGKVYVMAIRTTDGNHIVIAQNNYYTEKRMVWLAQQALVQDC